jgi:YkoP domain
MAEFARDHSGSPHSHPWLAETLFVFDALMRNHLGVIEYSDHPACIFRLEIAQSRVSLTLTDGTALRCGERVARLHFWNEHVPPLAGGATIRWARRMQQSISISLQELAHYLSSTPALGDISVVCGDVPSATRGQCLQVAHIMGYYGFETIIEESGLPLGERIHRLGENFLISLAVFAQNRAAFRFDTLMRVRVPIYMSRRALQHKFGSRSGGP